MGGACHYLGSKHQHIQLSAVFTANGEQLSGEEKEDNMLFKEKDAIKIVSGCPVAKGSVGSMEFSPELVAKIAGAVKDNIEWMVLLVGERSDDGFHVKVTGFRVPKQQRSSGAVNMTEPMEGDGSTVGDDVVGVLHSHHRMGAFFSGTDINELNPYFKTSIVVAQGDKTALGFKYLAEGKVTLPCGSIGRIAFRLAITDSPYWPVAVVREHDKNNNGLGDCDQVTVTETETDVEVVKAKVTPEACGLHVTVKTEKPAVFGDVGGKELLAEICQMTTGYGHGGYGHRGYTQQSPTLFTRAGDPIGVDNQRPSEGWFERNRQTGDYDETTTQHLSRRERKRLKRSGKLSARRNGNIHLMPEDSTFGTDYSAGGRHEVGGNDDVVSSDAPHKRAVSSRCNTGDVCEMCRDITTVHEFLYLYIGEKQEWRAWLCADCYDFCAGDGEQDVTADEVEDTSVPVVTSPVICVHGPEWECDRCAPKIGGPTMRELESSEVRQHGRYCQCSDCKSPTDALVCSHTGLKTDVCRCSVHRGMPVHQFVTGIGHPFCIARVSGRICGQPITNQCHLMPIRKFVGTGRSDNSKGEEKGRDVREKLHIAGIIPVPVH